MIFASSGAKIPQKMKIAIFLGFFHCLAFFFIVFFFFIIFASSGAKIFQKMKNCNFPRLFFISVHHICFIAQKFSKKCLKK